MEAETPRHSPDHKQSKRQTTEAGAKITRMPIQEKTQTTGALIERIATATDPEKRQEALDILAAVKYGKAATPFVTAYLGGLYRDAVQQITASNAPAENVSSVVEAGKILTELFPTDEQTHTTVSETWEVLSEQYPQEIFVKVLTEKTEASEKTDQPPETIIYEKAVPEQPQQRPGDNILALIELDYSNEEIAEELSLPVKTVAKKRSKLRSAGLTDKTSTDSRIAKAEARRAEVARLAKEGNDIGQIADLLDEEARLINRDWTVLSKRGELTARKERRASEIEDKPWYHPRFTREQEQILFTEFKQGGTTASLRDDDAFMDAFSESDREKWIDVEARSKGDFTDAIVRSYQNLTFAIAKRSLKTGLPFEGCISAANNGLLKAIKGFDPEAGYKFSSYAVPFMKAGIKEELCRRAEIPRRVYDGISKARLMEHAIRAALYEEPTHEGIRKQLIANTELPIPLIDRVMHELAKNPLYLDGKFLSDDERREDVINRIENELGSAEDTAIGIISQEERQDELYEAMKECLTIEEAITIQLVYGINHKDRISPKRIAEQTGRPIRQIHSLIERGFAKLRTKLEGPQEEETDNNKRAERKNPPRSVQRQRVQDLRNSSRDYTNQEIADQLGITASAVKKHVNKLLKDGLIEKRPQDLTREQRRQVMRLRNASRAYTNQEIADDVGISLHVLGNLLKSLLKDQIIKPQRFTREQTAAIREATRSPRTETVARWLRENKTQTHWTNL